MTAQSRLSDRREMVLRVVNEPVNQVHGLARWIDRQGKVSTVIERRA